MEISKQTARRFLLAKQLLYPPKSLFGKAGIAKVFEKVRSIQFDPQEPAGNNVDLVLQSRVKNIRPKDYYWWLYQKRQGIECFDKELCLAPIEDLPMCLEMFSKKNRQERIGQFLKKYQKEIKTLLKRIKTEGEISSFNIKDERKISNFWGNPRLGKAMLDALWREGKLVISKRERNRKYYNLPEKVYGKKLKWSVSAKPNVKAIIRRIKSVGLLPKSGAGSGWLGLGLGREISPLISRLLKDKVLIEVAVFASKRRYTALRSDIGLVRRINATALKPKMVFLAPLDNLLWDRETIRDIFEFDYKWEAYTPQSQRQYGHYVLPVLFKDRLVARIEPRYDENVLKIKGFWPEKGFKWTNEAKIAFKDCLDDFKEYLGAKEIRWSANKT